MNKKTLLAIVALATASLAGAQTANQNKMVLTTARAVGETIELGINAAEADQANVWIDLNNNGIKENGEAVTNFSDYNRQNYTLGAQTVTIYGNVTIFDCISNQVMALDVTNNPELTKLYCRSNKITALDVSKNINLLRLECANNLLTALDVSKNTNLLRLYCGVNQITSLDVSKNTNLYWLHIYRCKLDACALNAIFTALRPKSELLEEDEHSRITLGENPGVATSNFKILEDKEWGIDCYNEKERKYIVGDGSAVCPENSGINEESATIFAIYPNPAHATLHVSLPENMQARTLTLHDMTGRVVLSQTISGTSATLDIRALSRGLYVVKIGDIARKLVVK